MARGSVLVVEDDPAIRRGLVDALSFAGYSVTESPDGSDAVQLALELPIDLVLLDVMLPGLDGFTILEQLRQSKPTLPVIMVTARGAEDDRIHGLKVGADDYVVKPFSAKELLARVEAVMRRSPERPSDVRSLRANGLTIDLQRQEIVLADGTRRELSERETSILSYLASSRQRAIDRGELLQHVWGLNPRGIQTRTVDMHIARLREKLTDGTGNKPIIVTVRSKGYMLADFVEIESS